jgi:tetratricopeptide (TPR) repeat protein
LGGKEKWTDRFFKRVLLRFAQSMAAAVSAADHLATPLKGSGLDEQQGAPALKEGGGESFHTPAQQRGMIPTAPGELRALGNQALQDGNLVKACHMYTMAIDSLSRELKTDNGVASAADLYALNQQSGGELAKLLSNRSLAHLKQGDAAAAVEDADACVKADMTVEKGHMRLVVALEALAAPPEQQLRACEAGLQAVPQGSLLLARKQRLLKAVAAQPKTGQPVAQQEDRAPAESAIEATRRVADDPADPRRGAAPSLAPVTHPHTHASHREKVRERLCSPWSLLVLQRWRRRISAQRWLSAPLA